MPKDKDTKTVASEESTTEQTKVSTPADKDRTKEEYYYEGRGETGHLGLAVISVPAGLYKIKNMAGGKPPKFMQGLYTSRTEAENLVKAYNEANNKEG